MQKINHLYWRAGFGLSPQEWEEKKNWTINKALNDLFKQAQKARPLNNPSSLSNMNPNMMNKSALKELIEKERKKVGERNAEWILRMSSNNESALLERMTLFWHGHFACRSRSGHLAVNQLNAIRKHALGNFRDLVLAIAKDPSMIRYLNNQQNKKQSPNENFARELMELFTIGRGHYTEQDIKEAARAFTGWSSNLKGEYVFRRFQHDYGQKEFFGKKGNFDGTDIIDMLLEKRQTAYFISSKIYRYFVNTKIDEAIVRDLADGFYRSNYDIGQLMRRIFESPWFYEAKNIGHKVKSPVEYSAGLIRLLDIQFENQNGIIFLQRALGQTLFNPPNVAGWPGGKSWIDNSTLMLRLSVAAAILNQAEVAFRPKAEAEERVRKMGRLKATVNLGRFKELTAGIPDQQLFDYFKSYLLLADTKTSPMLFRRMMNGVKTREQLIQRGLVFFTSLPEFQMC